MTKKRKQKEVEKEVKLSLFPLIYWSVYSVSRFTIHQKFSFPGAGIRPYNKRLMGAGIFFGGK